MIVDIDGTLALWRIGHWSEDITQSTPNHALIEYIKKVNDPVVYMTARQEYMRAGVQQWLDAQGLVGRLLMRATGDEREDDEIKQELYLSLNESHSLVIDDKASVLAMFREHGLAGVLPYTGMTRRAPKKQGRHRHRRRPR